jgi:hypothetical protein
MTVSPLLPTRSVERHYGIQHRAPYESSIEEIGHARKRLGIRVDDSSRVKPKHATIAA